MNSRVSWSVDGIDPSVRERAEAAARRAGMSLNDWLNSTLGETAAAELPRDLTSSVRSPTDSSRIESQPSQESRDVADIHQRLDAITQQIERISKPAPRTATALARAGRRAPAQRCDLAARCPAVADFKPQGAAYAQRQAPAQAQPQPQAPQAISAPARSRCASARPIRSSARPRRSIARSPPLSPASFDVAVAEITARQSELDDLRRARCRRSPSIAPMRRCRRRWLRRSIVGERLSRRRSTMGAAAPCLRASAPAAGPDFTVARTAPAQDHQPDRDRCSGPTIPSRRSAGFRSELARDPPRHHRGDAAPRDRIDRERDPLAARGASTRPAPTGTDGQVLSGIEHALSEIKHGAAHADAGRAAHRL